MSGLEIALAHAERERDVFPFLLAKGAGGRLRKTPLVPWKSEATHDPVRIKAWWDARPQALPGWRLPEGLLVADVDDAGAFAAAGLVLPEAPSQATPSGGEHRLFRYEGSARQTVKEVPGLDTRTGGAGWVGLYSVDSFEGEPPAAPEWLTMPRSKSEERDYEELGHRDQIASWLGSLARAGQLTEAECRALLDAAYSGGRIVDLDPSDPWPPAFRDLARSAAGWSRRDASPVFVVRKPKRRTVVQRGWDGR